VGSLKRGNVRGKCLENDTIQTVEKRENKLGGERKNRIAGKNLWDKRVQVLTFLRRSYL